jgi:uncharacterized protein (DUF2062 family)
MRDFLQRRLIVPLLALLKQGVTPRELALSVALGVVIGLVPVLGASTPLCALAALALRLNMPAIQLVNYLLTPLQLLLIIPQLRLGEWLTQSPRFPITLEAGLAMLSQGVLTAITFLSTAILHATIGWLAVAPFAALLLFKLLEPVFRRLTPATSQGAR